MLKELLSKKVTESICVIAVIVRKDELLLGLRDYTFEHKENKSVWTAPGGRGEPGEDVETTLRRETKEETGIDDLEIKDYIGKVSGAGEGDKLLMFLASSNQDAELTEPEKFSEWQWFPVESFAEGEPSNYINEDARAQIVDYSSERGII